MSKVSLFYYEATQTVNGVTTKILSLNCPGCGAEVPQGVRHSCGDDKPAATRKASTRKAGPKNSKRGGRS